MLNDGRPEVREQERFKQFSEPKVMVQGILKSCSEAVDDRYPEAHGEVGWNLKEFSKKYIKGAFTLVWSALNGSKFVSSDRKLI